MRRELNEIEYFNWCVGQPYNMVVAVRVRGELSPDRLREALAKAQERHPLLAVNTEIGPRGLPWFDSEGVDPIPLTVVERADPEQAQRLMESELTSRFAMDQPGAPRLPLMRVCLFLPREPHQPADLVFTVQHVVADGLSMVFLVRDLLHFMEHPDEPVTVLDAPAKSDDLLPRRVRRFVPRTALLFRLALWLAHAYVWLRFGSRPQAAKQLVHHHLSWALSPDETARLRARAKAEGVSVQSAICTAFLPGFPAIHTPVSLRLALARPVGESVGLYVGAAEVNLEYRPARSFWDNARRFHRRLRKAMRNPFALFFLFSKAVPAPLVQRLGSLMLRIAAGTHQPFAVTNLGQLDGSGLQLQTTTLQIESFVGAVTGIVDSSVLTVYTIGGSMKLNLLASESGPEATAVRDEAQRAVARLLDAAGRLP
ncbi:MAG: condensation domain-containing protein [Myxococcales bacterium]